MLALTEVAPWGYAIMCMNKSVENRSWYPPEHIIGQRIAIHQGKKVDEQAVLNLEREYKRPIADKLVLGAVLGTVKLKGYVYVRPRGGMYAKGLTHDETDVVLSSEWRDPESRYLWVLTDPISLAAPVPCRGMQQLWQLPEDVLRAMQEQTAKQLEAAR